MQKIKTSTSTSAGAFDLKNFKDLGQHFLDSEEHLQLILNQARLACDDGAKQALEIGPGPGALTKTMLADAFAIHAIEMDERAIEGLQKTLQTAYPNQLSLEKSSILDAIPAQNYNLCIGNIPYYITSDILLWFCRYRNNFGSGIFMIQNEVAERLIATPRTKAYGRLSVKLQLIFDIEKCFVVPASAFVPPPKVNSAVVYLVKKQIQLLQDSEETDFGKFTAHLFTARRKMIRKAMESLENGTSDHSKMWDDLCHFGVLRTMRPEELTPEQFLKVFRYLRKNENQSSKL